MSIDLLIRKLSDNSTYYIVSNILGFNMGVNKYLIENKDANFYRFRNYTGNSTDIHEDFDRTRNGKYTDGKIVFNNNSSIVNNTKEVSMLENTKISQAIESDEYIYYCEPNYENLNEFFDKFQTGENGIQLMNKSRMHQFLFPVYVDNSTNDTATDFNIFRDFDIEINYGRNKIKTLEDFKIGYSFEYTLGTYDYTSGQGVHAYNMYMDSRGFDFFKRDALGSGAKIKRNVNIIGEKYSDWSRCRNSRGNRAYKYKVTATKYGDNSAKLDTTNSDTFGTLYEYRMHTDMIYGHGAESIHPYYSGDEFVSNTLMRRDFLYGANYSYSSILPTMPTMYVDFISEESDINYDASKIHSSYTDNLKLVGFIRLRMYSWLDIELNAGVLQKYYGDNKVPLRQWSNHVLKTEDYSGRYNAIPELTNTEGFTVKFTFDKRRPQYKYRRNEATAKSVYMLPTSIFENIITKDKDLDIVYGSDKIKGMLYTYVDFDKFVAYTVASGYGRGLQLDRNNTKNVAKGISSLGGWLFPPLHMEDFTGTWDYKGGRLKSSYLSAKPDPNGYVNQLFRINETSRSMAVYSNRIDTRMRDKLGGWT